MSVLGACWEQENFEKGSLFWVKTYFWIRIRFEERYIFGKEDLILGHAQELARNQHAGKEGKTTCRRKRNVACNKTSLTKIGLWFLIRIVMAISL